MKKRSGKDKKKTCNQLNRWVWLSFLAAGAFYLYAINSVAVLGYQIKEKEQEITRLQKEKENLEIKKAELTSLYAIEKEVKNEGMEKVEEVVYLGGPETVAYNQ